MSLTLQPEGTRPEVMASEAPEIAQKCEALWMAPTCPCQQGGQWVGTPHPSLSHQSLPPLLPAFPGQNLEPGTFQECWPWESRAHGRGLRATVSAMVPAHSRAAKGSNSRH